MTARTPDYGHGWKPGTFPATAVSAERARPLRGARTRDLADELHARGWVAIRSRELFRVGAMAEADDLALVRYGGVMDAVRGQLAHRLGGEIMRHLELGRRHLPDRCATEFRAECLLAPLLPVVKEDYDDG